MKLMNFLCLFICMSCTPGDVENKHNMGIAIKPTIIGRYSLDNEKCTLDNYLVEIKLVNVGDATIKFWIFSCSCFLNFVLDNKDFSLIGNSCDANYPELIELKSQQSLTIPIVIKNRDSSKIKMPKFKIGFVLVFESQHKFELNLMKTVDNFKKTQSQILWSNEIDLIQDTRNPYRIE